MKIRNLVRTDYEVISPEVVLSELDELLTSNSYLVVFEKERFLGILSSCHQDHQVDCPIGQRMNNCPEIDYDADLEEVCKIMLQQNHVEAPVFDKNEFVGVVTLNDIVQFLLKRGSQSELSSDNQDQSSSDEINELKKDIDEYQELIQVFTHYKLSIEKILKNKSDLLADVSHEIRNPLHIILSYTRQGLTKIDKNNHEQIHRYFSRIRDAGEKVLLLVDDLLDLSKLESGKTLYNFEECDLSELVEIVLDEYQLILESKQITHFFKKPETACLTRMDKNRILQVIRNLVSNAYKFSPDESHIRLEVDFLEQDIQFSIIDWGFGIPDKEFEKLFTKYTRTTQTNIKGTGLGLSIAFNIIKDHKGSIYARKNPEGGSIFTFTLPKAVKQ